MQKQSLNSEGSYIRRSSITDASTKSAFQSMRVDTLKGLPTDIDVRYFLIQHSRQKVRLFIEINEINQVRAGRNFKCVAAKTT